MNLDEATLERIIEQITRQVLIMVQEEQGKAEADNDGHPDVIYTGTDGYVHCLGRRR